MAKKKVAPKDALDLLAEGDPRRIIALLLWQNRFKSGLSVEIRKEDLEQFEKSTEYLGVLNPEVLIVRPKGRAAQAAQPAKDGRPAIPARPAEPDRPFVVVAVVEPGTANVLKPIESTEQNADRRDMALAIERARQKAPLLASLLLGMCQSGTFSNAELTEAANSLNVLARA